MYVVNVVDKLTTQPWRIKMTTKAKQAKKPSKVIYVATDAHVALAATAGTAAGNMVSSRIAFNDAAKALFMAKVVIGDARNCPLAKSFLSARFTGKVAASTKANALAGFRAAVASGKDYDENASQTAKRTEAKKAAATKPAATATAATKPAATAATPAATAAATKPAAATPATPAKPAASDADHVVAFSKKASAKKAAAELRKLVNKMKDNEEFSLLAACLIDALDEFDSEE
jgi:hypothetical protein